MVLLYRSMAKHIGWRQRLSKAAMKPLVHLRALLTREFISMTRNPADVAGVGTSTCI